MAHIHVGQMPNFLHHSIAVLALAMVPVAVRLAGSLRTNQGRAVLTTCLDGYSARLVALLIGGWELAAHGLPGEEPAAM